jgi:Fe2+ transport system protein B
MKGTIDMTDPNQVAIRLGILGEAMAHMQQNQQQANGQNQIAFGAIRDELRSIAQKLEDFSQTKHTTNEHSEAIRRIWDHMKLHQADDTAKFSDVIDKVMKAKETANKITYVALGLSLAVSITAAAIAYNWQKQSDDTNASLLKSSEQIQKADDRLDRIEIHMAGDQARPYKR